MRIVSDYYNIIIVYARVQGDVQPAQLIRSDHVRVDFILTANIFRTDLG